MKGRKLLVPFEISEGFIFWMVFGKGLILNNWIFFNINV